MIYFAALLTSMLLILSGAKASTLVCTKIAEQIEGDVGPPLKRLGAKEVECIVARLEGAIEVGDGDRITDELRAKKYLLYLDLNSPGGAIVDALQIGQEVRKQNLMTFVSEEGDTCASACFFIWVAGIYRSATGKLLIHRFVPTSAESQKFNSEELEAFYRQGARSVSRYLEEMDTVGDERKITELVLSTPAAQAVAVTAEFYPNLFHTFVPSRDQWLRQHCGEAYRKNIVCVIEAIIKDRSVPLPRQ